MTMSSSSDVDSSSLLMFVLSCSNYRITICLSAPARGKFTKYFYEKQHSEAHDDPEELEEAGHMLGSLPVENLKHHHVEDGAGGHALQGGRHLPRDVAGPELGDDDADTNTQGTGEAEHSQVGVEDEVLSSVLLELQTDTEVDDKLMECDGCKMKRH